jgi:hypothetical protein
LLERGKLLTAKLAKKIGKDREATSLFFFATFAALLRDLCG